MSKTKYKPSYKRVYIWFLKDQMFIKLSLLKSIISKE